MKKYLLLFTISFATYFSQAQYSLSFCEDVNTNGEAKMVSSSFMVEDAGGVMKFLIKADEKFNTDMLDFRIYYINENGIDEEILRLPHKIDPNWNFAWKEMVMFDSGNYKVKIYTGKGTYLTSANLSIKHR